jgi:hypothetical protein
MRILIWRSCFSRHGPRSRPKSIDTRNTRETPEPETIAEGIGGIGRPGAKARLRPEDPAAGRADLEKADLEKAGRGIVSGGRAAGRVDATAGRAASGQPESASARRRPQNRLRKFRSPSPPKTTEWIC